MNKIKKTGIIAGAVIGGTIGGTISLIGKVSKKKIIDEIGESIIESTILTGGIAGDVASGTTNVISGKIKKQDWKVDEGVNDFKSAGNQVVGNFLNNVHNLLDNGIEIVDGVKEKDIKKVKHGVKTLAKIAAVGAITVGAIKVSETAEDDKDID